MIETPTIDITSTAFALRLANLMMATRETSGQSRHLLAAASNGRFSARDLRQFEKAGRSLDESTIDELAQLYRCDLGQILPPRLPVVVTDFEVSAGGVHQGYSPEQPDALLVAYLHVVRTLRRRRHSPVVELRRDDLEVLAVFLREPRETVLHRLATLMNATQRKRAAMTGVLATGAAVIGLVGAAAAVDSPTTNPANDTNTNTTTVTSVVTTAPTTAVTTPPLVTVAPPPLVTVAPATTERFTPRTTPVQSVAPTVLPDESNVLTLPPSAPITSAVSVDEPPLPPSGP